MGDCDDGFEIGPEEIALLGAMAESFAAEEKERERIRRELEKEAEQDDDETYP
jgi:hypothetical protein